MGILLTYQHSLNHPVTNEGHWDLKILHNGGLKKFKYYGQVRHNGGIDLKVVRGGGEGLLAFDSMSRKYSASVFQNWHRIHFLLHFHICCFSCFLSFKQKKIILILVKSPIECLCFSSLWKSQFLLMCSKEGCSWKWLPVKLPA